MTQVISHYPSSTSDGSPQHSAEAENMLFLRLKNGSSADLTVDGSSTPVKFEVSATNGLPVQIDRLMFVIMDKGLVPSKFGGIAALTTGFKLEVIDTDGTTVLIDFLDGVTIKKNTDFGFLAGVDSVIDAGVGDDSLIVRWTISRVGAALRLEANEILRLTVQDDLTGLTSFGVMAQGMKQVQGH